MKITRLGLAEAGDGSPMVLFRQGTRAEAAAKFTSTPRRILRGVPEGVLEQRAGQREAREIPNRPGGAPAPPPGRLDPRPGIS